MKLFLLGLFFFGPQAMASYTYVYNDSPIRFKYNGKNYRVNPQRFQAECKKDGYCYFSVKGIRVKAPASRFTFSTQSKKTGSNRTEASAPCVDCALGGLASKTKTSSSRSSKGFIRPVSGRLSSPFGMRTHPIKRVRKMHNGIDLSGNNGRAVKAAKSGIIEVSYAQCKAGNSSCNGSAGNMITINHGDGTKTRYLHLNEKCRLPKRGTRVNQGDVIGCVGSTGGVTGPHLHFEIIINGRHVNPMNYI